MGCTKRKEYSHSSNYIVRCARLRIVPIIPTYYAVGSASKFSLAEHPIGTLSPRTTGKLQILYSVHAGLLLSYLLVEFEPLTIARYFLITTSAEKFF